MRRCGRKHGPVLDVDRIFGEGYPLLSLAPLMVQPQHRDLTLVEARLHENADYVARLARTIWKNEESFSPTPGRRFAGTHQHTAEPKMIPNEHDLRGAAGCFLRMAVGGQRIVQQPVEFGVGRALAFDELAERSTPLGDRPPDDLLDRADATSHAGDAEELPKQLVPDAASLKPRSKSKEFGLLRSGLVAPGEWRPPPRAHHRQDTGNDPAGKFLGVR